MNDLQIATNLRARLPGALAELFDAYGDRLFRYCWTMLRNREMAQTALHDTLVIAQAHIARLADPELLGPWLYSLARAECCRRRAVQPSGAGEPPALPGQRDADSRLMAWNAVSSMAADEREALDLTCRHDMDPGLVLGLCADDAQALLDRARANLERALGAEILISKGSDACPDRAEVMPGSAGTVTPEIRERVLRHAESCPACGPKLPRNVSAARVFAQLPAPEISPLVRAQVLGLLDNPKASAYREFIVTGASADLPMLAPPAAGSLTAVLPVAGVPEAGPRRARLRRSGAILAGVGAVAATVMILSSVVLGGSAGRLVAAGGAAPSAAATPPGLTAQSGPVGPSGQMVPRQSEVRAATAVPASTERSRPRPPSLPPAAATGSKGPATIADSTQPLPSTSQTPTATPAAPGALAVSPGSIDLGSGSAGQVTLTAVGGAVSWSASAPSAQVSLSSNSGTLQAGQSETLDVTVIRGSQGGTAVVVIQTLTSSPLTVDVSWTSVPGDPSPAGHRRHHQAPSAQDPSPTAPPPPA